MFSQGEAIVCDYTLYKKKQECPTPVPYRVYATIAFATSSVVMREK